MNLRAGLSALIVSAFLTFSGCSAPPIAADVAQELQSEVQGIAVLTARGDTSDAVAAAHGLASRVRTAQINGEISGDRAVMILQRIEQLIDRLVSSGAAPAASDLPQPLAGPAVPVVPPPAVPEPVKTLEPAPSAAPEPQQAPVSPETPEPVPNVNTDTPEAGEPEGDAQDSSGSGSSGSGFDVGSSSNGGAGNRSVPVPVGADPANDADDDDANDAANDDDDDDDGGKGRGRGRSSDD